MDIGCSGTDESWNMSFRDVQDLCCYILLLGKQQILSFSYFSCMFYVDMDVMSGLPATKLSILLCAITSTLRRSRPNKAGLKCPSVCPSVRPSVCSQSFFDFNEIWHVGRGRWVMHDCILNDLFCVGWDVKPLTQWTYIFATYLHIDRVNTYFGFCILTDYDSLTCCAYVDFS